VTSVAPDDHRRQPVDAMCDDSYLHVELADGRVISVPVGWAPALEAATPTERNAMEFMSASVFWPELGAEIAVSDLLAGEAAVKAAVAPQPELEADALLRSVSERMDQ
jgi:hypothetical protein